ncbi:unknown protein [Desulfotalea psychrophila LSv54]|uniref:Uncharacterized protein n=1 Tax=Desulfotalea psychrophila (strain LSv54 / DSM 12343) TaxID=177439 RepID=Q6AK34_DESPS|nr:unknown protein [Desulfotalea psychrophila LSv54]
MIQISCILINQLTASVVQREVPQWGRHCRVRDSAIISISAIDMASISMKKQAEYFRKQAYHAVTCF